MAIVARWLRSLRARRGEPQALTVREPKTVDGSAEHAWIAVGSFSSAALGAMYADLLEQSSIPVLRQEWGGGSALLGGVPVGVRLLVPRDRVEEARVVLGDDNAEREDSHEG